jgi:hypothetical protein
MPQPSIREDPPPEGEEISWQRAWRIADRLAELLIAHCCTCPQCLRTVDDDPDAENDQEIVECAESARLDQAHARWMKKARALFALAKVREIIQ